MNDDPRCSNCHIPLRAVVKVVDGRCADEEACDLRKKYLTAAGGGALLSPEGVTRIDP